MIDQLNFSFSHNIYDLPFHFKDFDGEMLVMLLNSDGIYISTGSACSTGSIEPSHVLLATGQRREEAWENIRITIGKDTEENDINRLLKIIKKQY